MQSAVEFPEFGVSGRNDTIVSHYSDEAVLFLPDNMQHGRDEVRGFFVTLLATLPADWMANFKMIRQEIEGEVAFIFWQAPPVFPLATDTFVVRNGEIVAQSISRILCGKGRHSRSVRWRWLCLVVERRSRSGA